MAPMSVGWGTLRDARAKSQSWQWVRYLSQQQCEDIDIEVTGEGVTGAWLG